LLNRDKANDQNFLVYLNLILAKDSMMRFIILPAVSSNCFYDYLNIMNNKMRLSLAFILYQAELYATNSISLL